jgi:hypothetical protein
MRLLHFTDSSTNIHGRCCACKGNTSPHGLCDCVQLEGRMASAEAALQQGNQRGVLGRHGPPYSPKRRAGPIDQIRVDTPRKVVCWFAKLEKLLRAFLCLCLWCTETSRRKCPGATNIFNRVLNATYICAHSVYKFRSAE